MNTIWDERNYTEQEKSCLSSNASDPSGSMKEIRSGSMMNAWHAIGSLNWMYKLCYNGETGEYLGDNKSHVVYLWTETRDGVEYPCYVGQTYQKIKSRCISHIRKQKAYLFQRKLRKYPKRFKCYILEHNTDIGRLNELERFYIKMFSTFVNDNPLGYNLTDGGNNAKQSIESRAKRSKKLKGRIFSEESKKKMSDSQKKVSRDWVITDETREKLSAAMTGRKWTDEMRRNMSNSIKGRKLSPEWIKNMALSRMGKKRKPHSEETKRKLSLATKIQFGTATESEIKEYKLGKKNNE
jgi:hypothetical protein